MEDVASEGMRIRVGEVEVIGLTDAVTPLPITPSQTFPTVSQEEWREYRGLYPGTFGGPDALRVRIGCGIVRTPERTILVDTGVGPSDTAFSRWLQVDGRLPGRLRAAGIDAADIDVVFLTHLHSDHVGWNAGGEDRRPTFPNARYIATEADWEMCRWRLEHAPHNAGYVRENVIPLLERGLLRLVDGRAFGLADDVKAVPTPGHTPGHMSVKIGPEPGKSVWLLGDVVAHPLQVTEPAHSYRFDADPEQAIETRLRVLREVEGEDSVMAPAHFLGPGFGRVARKGGKRYWQPI